MTEARTGADIDTAAVRAAVQAAGESAIVAGSRAKLRLHVHTDAPAGLFAKVREFGTIAEIKADDMRRQYEAAHRRMSAVAIVTDSACDLPPEVLDEHQVHLIPFTLSFGDSQFLDKVTITPGEFYRLLKSRRDVPRSAQPSQAAVRRQLELLAGLLNIKPIVTLDGEGKAVALGKSFSRRRNMSKIVGLVRREARGKKVWNYAVVYAQNPYRALHYAEELTPVLGREPAFIMDISPVIGVHNGIGAVGVCVMFE